jgi:uncharacterized OB-fold protein
MAEEKKVATRPLPSLKEADTGPFWAATKEHELRYQRCDDCQTVVFYPRGHCTSCLGRNLSWHTSRGEGTVYTYSVIRQSYHPFFRGKVPFAVAWIDLDEGPRLLSNITGVDDPTSDVAVGQRVRVEWEDHDELAIPLFRPVE